MKILLVSVPLEFPLAAYCLAAHLSATPDTEDVSIELLNLDISKLNEYERKSAECWRYMATIEAVKPDVVAFSMYLWCSLPIRELIAITHKLYPELILVVGGPEVSTVQAAESLVSGGEVIAVRGEGEITMVELVQRLGNGDLAAGVAGCSWFRNGKVVHEPPRPPVRDLASLASPFITGWVKEDLFARTSPILEGPYPRAFLETYRGCYMQCSYCQWGNGTKERFPFSQERIRAELSWILSHHVRTLFIVDAMFGYTKNTAKDLLRFIIEEKRRYGSVTNIVCYHNQDFFDTELFDLYREANVSVEVDLQSINRDVLGRAGRAKWYIESFDRHLKAFHERRVPTTGSADLMIGLPYDNLASFAESVDFMLRRGMNINLYQTSMIPGTNMLRDADDDGTVFSHLPPRAVFKNQTFPVHDIIRARLIGHGVDFFRIYPRTARLLWHHGYTRPVDLCLQLGELLWERHNMMYDESRRREMVSHEEQEMLAGLLDELCPHEWLRPLVGELFRFEGTIARLASHHRAVSTYLTPVCASEFSGGDAWLTAKPRYRREAIEECRCEHRVDDAYRALEKGNPLPPETFWRRLAQEPHHLVALIYAYGPDRTGFSLIDEKPSYHLLARLFGFFTVAECIETFKRDWSDFELKSLFSVLSSLSSAGVIQIEFHVSV